MIKMSKNNNNDKSKKVKSTTQTSPLNKSYPELIAVGIRYKRTKKA